MNKIYPTILNNELLAAGIKTGGSNASSGKVWAEDGVTEIQDRPDVQVIIAAHLKNIYDVDEVGNLQKKYEIFELPIHAPDFIVSSPKPKDNPSEALTEAIVESIKANKSIALIVLNLVKYLEDVERRLAKAKI